MTVPVILTQTNSNSYKNPGNGLFRIIQRKGIRSITIASFDSDITITGTIVFSIGDKSITLDLEKGERWIRLLELSPYVDLEIKNSKNEKFEIIIL